MNEKEGHYIMIKGSIQQEDITIVNIYVPNLGATQCIRQTLTDIKGEIDSNTIIVGDFNTPLTPKQKIIRKYKYYMIHYMRWISLVSSGHSKEMQKNTPSSHVHMKHSTG